ncbi:MAG: M48 family metalloprotease [Fimbriimonadales bacterium]|nr:M48 family metalloprotease [Fimbriimonadales bacterium]
MHSLWKRIIVSLASLGLAGALLAQEHAHEHKHGELTPRDQQEIEFGKKVVAEIEKNYKFVTDPELVERVNRIGQTLAEIARRTETQARYGESGPAPFEYTFRIIDEKDVNAFSVPGGFIFVNRGLLEFVSSDDELAGVLAHEIAHASHRHVMKLIRDDAKVQQSVLLPALLVGVFGRLPSQDFAGLMTGAQLYRIARVSSFSQEAEVDSDLTALEYLRRSPYSPVGLLVFMERLAAEERRRPQIDWGIFRTHPITRERVETIKRALQEYNIPIRRREISPALQVHALMLDKEQPDGLYEVRFERIQIFTPAHHPEQGASRARAARIASMLNQLLDDGVQLFEVQLSEDKQAVLVKGREVVRVTPEDAQLAGKSIPEVADAAREAIRRLLWSDAVRMSF